VIYLHLGAEDLRRIRFAISPAWETVTSLRTLGTAADTGLHSWWLRAVRPRLSQADMQLLTALVRPHGYIPDFLHPFPPRRASSFEAGLAQIAASNPQLVAAELAHLAGHPRAQQGPGRQARLDLLSQLIASPVAGLSRIVAELEQYWKVALAPYWPRVRSLLDADLAYRLDQLADGGMQQLLSTLHPLVSIDRDTVRVVKYYQGHADLRGRGMLLIPCTFAWPEVIVRTADPQPALTYAPRGLGRLWQAPHTEHRSPLAEVLGHTRATLLGQLDLPMTTTQLAALLSLTAPTLNVHLKSLQAAGLVSSRRDGRSVLYVRTDLGERLLAGSSGHGCNGGE
jgi:DNA-binding transcriptional ArsR family regulator